MGDFKSFAIGFALITLVVFATYVVILNVGTTYEITDMSFGGLQFEDFNQSMYNINNSADALYRGVTPSKNVVADIWEGLTLFNPVTALAKEVFITPIGLIFGIITDVLHFPTWLTIIVSAVFLIAIIFGIIKLLKVGE